MQDMEGLVRFAGTVLKLTLVIEGIGAAILALRWWPVMGFRDALWHGVFHAVSAFNNAGFALWSNNLIVVARRRDGQPGHHLPDHRRRARLLRLGRAHPACDRRHVRLSVHTRLVLVATAALLAGGTVAFLAARVEQPAHAGRAADRRTGAGRLVPVGHRAHRRLQHHRHRRHDRAGAVRDDGADVHRRIAGQHRRRREDDDVLDHPGGAVGHGARRRRHGDLQAPAGRRKWSPRPSSSR